MPTNRLRTLDFNKDGTLWIGTTGGGLVSFASEKFTVMNPTNGFPHLEVRHVLADPAGGTWAATAEAPLLQSSRPPGATSPPPGTTSRVAVGTASLDFANNGSTSDVGRITYTFTNGTKLVRTIQRLKP